MIKKVYVVMHGDKVFSVHTSAKDAAKRVKKNEGWRLAGMRLVYRIKA